MNAAYFNPIHIGGFFTCNQAQMVNQITDFAPFCVVHREREREREREQGSQFSSNDDLFYFLTVNVLVRVFFNQILGEFLKTCHFEIFALQHWNVSSY